MKTQSLKYSCKGEFFVKKWTCINLTLKANILNTT